MKGKLTGGEEEPYAEDVTEVVALRHQDETHPYLHQYKKSSLGASAEPCLEWGAPTESG